MSNSPHTLSSPAPFPGAAYDVVGLVSSAGGLPVLTQILSELPADFPAAIVIVQHLDPNNPSFMVDILKRHTDLTVEQAAEGTPLKPGTVYVAPPNYHLLVNADGHLTLTQTKRIHFVRPSADLLFQSLADSYHHRAIAVVLTGTGQDGAQGICAIKAKGGTTLAQEPASAEFAGMPRAAIQTGQVDQVVPLADIPQALISLVLEPKTA